MSVGPFGPISVAPNFTTSQTVSNAISQSFGGTQYSAGSYVAGQQSVGGSGGSTKSNLLGLGLLAAVLGGLWLLFRPKKKASE